MSWPALPDDRPLRVLSLSGGGFLGLYTATVLEGLEARAGEPLARRFDLIAGTSIGGLLALALAYEIPMTRLVRLFVEHGPAVFSSRELPRGAMSRLLDLSRSVLGPKYSGDALREALQAEIGERRLADALHRVVVPAVDVGLCQTKIFKTPHAQASQGDGELRAVDVAMAACAAPAYFPCVRIGRRIYADGGLFAVAPDQVALHELEHFMGIAPARVSMLSIGTATAHYRPAEGVRGDAGAVGWLSDGRLVLTLLSVQQQHVQAMVEDRLAARYLRLDADWPAAAGLGIDVATPQAVQALTALARRTLSRTSRRKRWPHSWLVLIQRKARAAQAPRLVDASRAAASQPRGRRHATERVKGTIVKTDADLKRDVTAELAWDPAVKSTAIGVAVKDGVVTLTGHIDTFAEKHAAMRALRRVAGVKAIALELDVKLAPGHVRNDTEIAESAEQALKWSTVVPLESIRVTVDHGWVTLQGDVEWDYQRRSVEQAIRPLMGVVGIGNEIVVRAKPKLADLQRKIEQALTRQAIREAQHVQVAVDGSTIKLTGKVHSWQERDAVQGVAWSAPGVSVVVNELKVG